MQISIEQNTIIGYINNYNVCVNSVAGSGKTTTALYIAKAYTNLNILLLTFNTRLRLETKQRLQYLNINNLEVHTFHSFGYKYYDKNCKTDIGLNTIMHNNLNNSFEYDIIIIDEIQDVSSLYFKFIKKIISDNITDYKLCIFGDVDQCIFKFKNADERFLIYIDKLIKNKYEWKKCTLNISYRLSTELALFINNICINKNIATIKSGVKPRYLIMNTYKQAYLEFLHYINLGYNYSDIFILAPSIKSDSTPIRVLENTIKTEFENINIFIPISDDESIDLEVIENKLVFSTFHQIKGLERKIIIILNFDESYFKFYNKDDSNNFCSNQLYVALTRSIEHISLLHDSKYDFLKFINKDVINKYCDLIIYSDLNIRQTIPKQINKTEKVTNLIKFLPHYIILNVMSKIKITKIETNGNKIFYKTKYKEEINGVKYCENISDIIGVAIPVFYQLNKGIKVDFFDTLKTENFDINKKNTRYKLNTFDYDNLSIEQIFYLSNCWISYINGYIFKLSQIKNYNFIDKSKIDSFIQNFDLLKLSTKAKYEQMILTYNEKYDVDLCGFIDCIDGNNIYEFKNVDFLTEEHYIQLIVYMYIKLKTDIKQFNYFLYNCRTSELLKITCSNKHIEEIIESIFYYKYMHSYIITDDEFIKQNL